MNFGTILWVAAGGTALTVAFLANWERPPVDSVQRGYRGVGIQQVYNPRTLAEQVPDNQVPESPWELDPTYEGERAGDIYENVQVLGDLNDDEFNHYMAAITEWVSPEQGCAYCHNEENYADDSVYTKIVSRRMMQMTLEINGNWQSHVQQAGVNCYTCHRGNNVPEYLWFEDPHARSVGMGLLGNPAGQNKSDETAAYASLPADPLQPFLLDDAGIRVQSDTALPEGNRQSIKQTEWTYSLMMHMSDSLGVNCTYCHNSRAWGDWEQSSPQRTTAWYGIRMTRALNQDYLEPLGVQYPPHRLGPLGDAPKVNCATCHQGAYKPLYGANMVADYPYLAGEGQLPEPAPEQTAALDGKPLPDDAAQN